MPVRFAFPTHARGYNENYDNYSHLFHETNLALMNCKETDQFVYIFKKYGNHMTDVQKAYAFNFIARQQLERSPDFWNIILPECKA